MGGVAIFRLVISQGWGSKEATLKPFGVLHPDGLDITMANGKEQGMKCEVLKNGSIWLHTREPLVRVLCIFLLRISYSEFICQSQKRAYSIM